ncbi:MAG TPA: bifunctional phosphopantothenoylcysteine decarboxylase/phosphopantothenate--cysteine ligase CoaBC, partial [Nitrospirae bacterium]|nr:bifunctional phosphopantothenoylcysteine decarboxylase/phosphopantothenate--cysteine ligase CoaBC [Nitrospirota bacterium]
MSPLSLKNREIVLAVTGGIAAYKSAEIIRRLTNEGASVTVLMTEAATRFITPLTLEVLSGRKVIRDIFDPPLAHLKVTEKADIFLIAPATADIISKIASGIADDIVSLSVLSFKGKVLVAPSMNWRMYENPVVQENLERLKERGLYEIVPESGSLACGEQGRGRMASVDRIVDSIKDALHPKDMAGMKVLVTAGPTREFIDPVRFISNPSSGKMGFALARV